MQVGIISPNKSLGLSRLGDYYFVLAHRYETDESYRGFFLEIAKNRCRKWILLDNGAFELGTSMAVDRLLDIVKELQPNEVVAPDRLMDGPKSLNMAQEFIPLVPKDVNICVIPHGKNVDEFVHYYKEVANLIRVDTIGLSIVFHKRYKQLRPHVYNYLAKQDILDKQRDIHLFGLDSLAELWCYQAGNIRSVDTSLPISCAWNRIGLPECDLPRKHKRVPDDVNLDLTQWQEAKQYINKLLYVAHRVG